MKRRRGLKMIQNPVITANAAQAMALGKNGSYSDSGNILDDTLWDTEPFANTTVRATTTFFSAPQNSPNQAGNNKTETETNLTDPSKLPNGQTFLITKISLACLFGVVGTDIDANTVLAAFYNIIQNSNFYIKLAGREFDFRVPGSKFVPNYALAGLASGANEHATQAKMISTGVLQLKVAPIPIGQMVSFNVIQRTQSATATIAAIVNTASGVLYAQDAQLQVRLDGVLTRAI